MIDNYKGNSIQKTFILRIKAIRFDTIKYTRLIFEVTPSFVRLKVARNKSSNKFLRPSRNLIRRITSKSGISSTTSNSGTLRSYNLGDKKKNLGSSRPIYIPNQASGKSLLNFWPCSLKSIGQKGWHVMKQTIYGKNIDRDAHQL